MKTKEEILDEYGCPSVPFDEQVAMNYYAILEAMEEYANQKKEFLEKKMSDTSADNLGLAAAAMEALVVLQELYEAGYWTLEDVEISEQISMWDKAKNLLEKSGYHKDKLEDG